VVWDAGAREAPARARSLVDYLEAHADEIRARYLAWVHELGELVVNGLPLRERFAFADGVNLWSMSVFVEQSPWRQRSVEPILKVMAFELLLERESPSSVRYCGDAALAQVLRAVCARRGVACETDILPTQTSKAGESWRHRLPQSLQAMLGIVYLAVTRLPLRIARRAAGDARKRILISAPYFNHNGREAGARDFESKFWTALPATLEAGGYEVTWLHSFYAHAAAPRVADAQEQIARLNQSHGSRGRHLLLDSFLTLRGLFRIAGRACVIAGRSFTAARALRARVPYWPLMKADWAKAFRGAGCVENLMFSECFDRALESLPRQDEGLYLMECQGWERALCHAWRRRGHGRLAGSLHSTIRYWDLRYHCDPRRYEGSPHRLPEPDVVVANGRAACRQYLSTCSGREDVYEAEAVRYLHLGNPAAAPSVPSGILVVGDYLQESTDSVMKLVEEACADTGTALEIRVKPHPNSPVVSSRFPRIHFSVAAGNVADLARASRIVISGNLTSAAVDAYVAGACVLVQDDGRGPNYSPLRGEPGVTFVRTAAELRDAISAVGVSLPVASARTDFFHTDAGLPRWRRYFGIQQRDAA